MKRVIDKSTFTRKGNTHLKELCLATQAPLEHPRGLTQFLEEIQCLNSFKSCNSEGYKARVA